MRALLCLTLLLGLVGCGGNPPPEEEPKQQDMPKKKKRKHLGSLTFHEFKGTEPTQKTDKAIVGKGVTLVNPKGEDVELNTLLGKPLVMVFMRGFNGMICPYCTTYTAQMAVRYEEFRAAGGDILVIYPTRDKDAGQIELFTELVEEIIADEGEQAIPFPVYLDLGTKVVDKYNLNGDLSKPTTFVLDPKGKIQYLYVGRDTDDRPSLDRVLAEVRKITGK